MGKQLLLTYINPLNKNYKGEFTYEFLFSKTLEINSGEDWDQTPASSGQITPPPIDEIEQVAILKTDDIELDLALYSDNFSMIDCVENIIALGWEKEPPDEEKRLVFHFGDTYEEVKDQIYSRDKIMQIVNDI